MSSLRDGMGGEEIQVSGIETSGTNAVYVSPYFLGSVTTEDQISGANIYSTAALHGENVYGDTVVSGASLKGGNVNADTGSVSDIVNTQGELQSVAAGSTYGAIVQAGSVHFATAGSDTIAFKTTYAGIPSVVVSIGSVASAIGRATVGAGSAVLYVNNISAGSFQVVCELGSGGVGYTDGPLVNWISAGI